MTARKTAKKKAAPGKGKRNRLTDLKCAWRHATPEQRTEFANLICAGGSPMDLAYSIVHGTLFEHGGAGEPARDPDHALPMGVPAEAKE